MARMLRKEIRELLREPWLCGAIFCLLAVLGYQLASWDRFYQQAQEKLQQRQVESRHDWLNQPTDSAHMATHHGTSVYKVLSPLASFDPGVDRLLGTGLRLESHHQHRMTEPLVTEVADPLQFDVSSPALLIQTLFPLFMILLGFSAVSRERELGTLPLILSTGVSWQKLVLSKLSANFLLAVCLLSPLILFLIWAATDFSLSANMSWIQLAGRSLLLFLCSLLFLGGWGFLSVAVSARAASSRMALIILLTLWAGWVVVIPRVMTHLAGLSVPLPDVYQVERQKTESVAYGEGGEHAFRKVYAELEQELLKKYQVERLEDLPVNLEGEKLLAAESYTDRVYDEVMSGVERVYAQQDRYVKNFMFVSPYLAMRAVSMSLSGADRLHHEYFYRAAENYRRDLVKKMNEFEAGKKPDEQEFDGQSVWNLVPEFQYRFPDLADVLRQNQLPLLALLVWFFATAGLALCLPRRFRVRN